MINAFDWLFFLKLTKWIVDYKTFKSSSKWEGGKVKRKIKRDAKDQIDCISAFEKVKGHDCINKKERKAR